MRSILIGAVLVAGYYALIFSYSARMRAERQEHVAWRFPLRGGSDYCADPLPNGAVVCSDNGTIFIVKDGKELARFKAFEGNAETRNYSPYEGYQWVGGTKDNLALVSVARPPMNSLALYAIECSGKVRWQVPMPPGEVVSWIACSPDSIFVLTYELTSSANLNQQRTMPVSRVHRYSLDGKQIYRIAPSINVQQLCVTADNWTYLADSANATIEARDPSGELVWQTPSGGAMPIYSSYGDGNKLFYIDSTMKLHGVGRDGKELFATRLPTQGTASPNVLDEFRGLLGNGGRYGYWPGSYNSCTFADGGDRIYHTDGRELIGLDTAGRKVWQRELRSYPLAITADSKGRAYVTLSAGGLICYSADGKEIWRNAALRDFTSAMSVGHDDRVYVETKDELICLEP